MVPGGLHGLQVGNEALCDGKWGSFVAKRSEWLRRFLDLEDWPAFEASMQRLLTMIDEIRHKPDRPATVAILSIDIHFSYVARATFDDIIPCRVDQIVSSSIRTSLARRDRRIVRFAISRRADV